MPTNSLLRFTLDAAQFLPTQGDEYEDFKTFQIDFYSRNSQPIAHLQVTLLQEQFVNLKLRQGTVHLDSPWFITKAQKLEISLNLHTGIVYFNGKRVQFQLLSATPDNDEVETAQPFLDAPEKPKEWTEIEEYLASELQESIELSWSAAPFQRTFVEPEQAAKDAKIFPSISFDDVKYLVTADEHVIAEVSIEVEQALGWSFSRLYSSASWKEVDKETLLMTAVIGGFISYLIILSLLSRMTLKKKSSRVKESPISATNLLSSASTTVFNKAGSSQTKSTDILRPVMAVHVSKDFLNHSLTLRLVDSFN